MPRRIKRFAPPGQEDLVGDTSRPMEKKARKKRQPSAADKRRQLMLVTVEALDLLEADKRDEDAFEQVEPRIFVGIHAYFYEQILGVFPDDLAKDYPKAVGAARRMLRDDFRGSSPRMLSFVKWAWRRERERERRRSSDGQGARLTWQRLFGPYVLQDWRVDQARVGKRRKR